MMKVHVQKYLDNLRFTKCLKANNNDHSFGVVIDIYVKFLKTKEKTKNFMLLL